MDKKDTGVQMTHYVGDACEGGHKETERIVDHRHVCIVCEVRWECKDRRQCLGPIRNTCPMCKSAPLRDAWRDRLSNGRPL